MWKGWKWIYAIGNGDPKEKDQQDLRRRKGKICVLGSFRCILEEQLNVKDLFSGWEYRNILKEP